MPRVFFFFFPLLTSNSHSFCLYLSSLPSCPNLFPPRTSAIECYKIHNTNHQPSRYTAKQKQHLLQTIKPLAINRSWTIKGLIGCWHPFRIFFLQIFGGLVFVPLSEPYLRSEWGDFFEERAPICLAEPWMKNLRSFPEEEAVFSCFFFIFSARLDVKFKGRRLQTSMV